MDRFEGFIYDLPEYGEMVYSPATDSVHRFTDERYDHVTYWDEERHMMTLQWVTRAVMDDLVELGLPQTPRDSVTSLEHDAWQTWQDEKREAQEEIIDSVVAAEIVHLDDEIDELLG